MYKQIYELLGKNGRVKSAVILTGRDMGARCVCADAACVSVDGGNVDWSGYEREIFLTQETKVIDVEGVEIFVEIFQKNPRLVILGGGHVSCPVAHMGKMLGFHVTVMDDRREFLTRERFPDADELVEGSFEEMSEKIPEYENAYYVVVTRGHAADSVCARQILRRPYVYFGMIGSRNKVRLTREKLLREGFTENELASMHAPIGLPLGGQLPEEIAVSIIAEIVQVKNKNYTAFTDAKVGTALMEGGKGVMLTIVRKSGSSPRGSGSKMFISNDGACYGSIGGGSVEYEAMKRAKEVDGAFTEHYNLSVNDDRNLGMICGGSVEVLFERI